MKRAGSLGRVVLFGGNENIVVHPLVSIYLSHAQQRTLLYHSIQLLISGLHDTIVQVIRPLLRHFCMSGGGLRFITCFENIGPKARPVRTIYLTPTRRQEVVGPNS
jgi:hypothetical protein